MNQRHHSSVVSPREQLNTTLDTARPAKIGREPTQISDQIVKLNFFHNLGSGVICVTLPAKHMSEGSLKRLLFSFLMYILVEHFGL